MLSRRAFVGKLAAGATGAAVVLAASGSRAKATPVPSGVSGETNRGETTGEAPNGAAAQLKTSKPEIDSAAPTTVGAPAPWELLQPLAMGSVVGRGWRVVDLSGVVDGACVLTLQNERQRTHRVHLCRNDGRPQGLVYTDNLDLVIMNGGQGDVPTEEGLAKAVAEVAHILAANERKRLQEPVVTALLPHTERVRQFSGPAGRRLR